MEIIGAAGKIDKNSNVFKPSQYREALHLLRRPEVHLLGPVTVLLRPALLPPQEEEEAH